jgi:hypothetical protein
MFAFQYNPQSILGDIRRDRLVYGIEFVVYDATLLDCEYSKKIALRRQLGLDILCRLLALSCFLCLDFFAFCGKSKKFYLFLGENLIVADELLDRLKEMFNIKHDQELADILGIKNNVLSGWRGRNSMVAALKRIVEKCPEASIDALIKGSVQVAAIGLSNTIHYGGSTLDPNIKSLLDVALSCGSAQEIEELSQNIKRLIIDFISKKHSNPEKDKEG